MQPFKVEVLLATSRSLISYCLFVRPREVENPVMRQSLIDKFEELRVLCEELRLPVANKQIKNGQEYLSNVHIRLNPEEYQRMSNLFVSTMETELSLRLFYAIKPEHAPLMNDPAGFGSEVADKFPSASYDIDEASRCLALGRYTAAVFHLMRIMEIGIRGMSRCLGVPDPIKQAERNWWAIQRKIKEAMEERGGNSALKRWARPEDQAVFEDACAFLDAVRNAWRNATMHVENKYTDEEADTIYRAVKMFTRKLASRFDEAGQPLA